MNTYFQHGGSPVMGAAGTQQQRTARSAALLIDFDNVTLGVHSDLGRELKTLINSEVFRGKIAVRRAYADWRRFPNYVVPLTEASIDLIFAPAYGSSKKNTTDLRMSADAIELAFTRPEIDTFILLTGDSDFSSTVMKLKEYGKYVIGVGMRESSSDLIIQNCDEYFSYHALTGLTKTTAGEGMKEDPWELAIRAAQKMAATGDAMRTDRLKQVMLSIDPGFNEKELGYSKFSRFVAELEKKGLVRLHKLPDGQYEILVDGRTAAVPAAPAADGAPAPRESRGPRDGRRDRRGRRREPVEAETRPPQVAAKAPAEPVEAVPEPVPAPVVAEPEPAQPAAEATEPVAAEATVQNRPMRESLALLQRAVRDLAPKRGVSVRDGDVKRQMVELEASFDEAKLGFSKFSRFLRAAHDAEAIDLQRLESGSYEVTLGSRTYSRPQAAAEAAATTPTAPVEVVKPVMDAPPAVTPPPSPPAAESARALRGRRRGRGAAAPEVGAPPILPGQVMPAPRGDEGREPAREERAPAAAAEAAAEPQQAAVAEPVAAEAGRPVAEEAAAAAPARRRGRRGRRDRAEVAPPQVLPEQVIEVAAPAAPTEVAVEEAPAHQPAAEAAEPAAPAVKKRRSRSRGRKAKGAEAAPVAAEPAETAQPAFSAEALGLPTDPAEITAYVTRTYRGVGKKTVEPLLEAFGSDIFRVFEKEPQRVREAIGDRRADAVLSQWAEDYTRRVPAAPAEAEAVPVQEVQEVQEAVQPEPVEKAAAVAEPEAAAPAATEEPEAPARRTRRSTSRGRRSAKSANAATPTGEGAQPPAAKRGKAKPAEAKVEAKPAAESVSAPAKEGRGRKSGAAKSAPVPVSSAPDPKPASGDTGQGSKRPRSRGGGKGRGGRRKPEASES